jgi:hypothetical protein
MMKLFLGIFFTTLAITGMFGQRIKVRQIADSYKATTKTKTVSTKVGNTINTGNNLRPNALCLTNASTVSETICEGTSLSLVITDLMDVPYTDPAFVWQWSLPNGSSINGTGTAGNPISIPNFGPDDVGLYLVTVSKNDNSCDPLLFIAFDLDIKLKKETFLNPQICEGQPYVLPDGSMANTSMAGVFPSTWVATSAGMPECEDDSTINVNLTVKKVGRNTVNATFCEGKSYTLPSPTGVPGQVVTAPSIYTVTFPNGAASGCDSIITVNLTRLSTTRATINAVVCPGRTYTLPNGEIVATPATYVRTILNVAGCDSIVTVNLTAGQNKATTVNRKLCPGGSIVLPDGVVITASGPYISTIPTTAGCDSVITTIVTDFIAIPKDTTLYICAGGSVQLPNGMFTSNIGIVLVTLPSVDGCDSNIIVDVRNGVVTPTIINPAPLCFGDSYTLPNGSVVNASGTYDFVYKAVSGCDSLVRTNLIVYPEVKTILDPVTLCNGDEYILPDGSSTTVSGTFTVKSSIPATTGCDSLLVTEVTVNPIYDRTINVNLCEGEIFNFPDGSATTTQYFYKVLMAAIV